MSFFEVFQNFFNHFFPDGTLLPVVKDMVIAVASIGSLLAVLAFFISLLGCKSRVLPVVAIVLLTAVCIIYILSGTTAFVL